MQATKLTKQQIYKAIDELPPESLPEVAQFLEFLKFKQAQEQAIPQKRIVKLGGLWKDQPEITDEDIAEARREMWSKFGERDDL